jgi:uncharacterized membrane protein
LGAQAQQRYIPPMEGIRELAEHIVIEAVQWLRLGVELTGAFVIALGVLGGFRRFLTALLRRQASDFTAIRLTLARYLALALEFQLGADILSTAVAPSWTEIGKLGAIAVIRTALNFFLSREMQEERGTSAAERHVDAASRPSGEHQ